MTNNQYHLFCHTFLLTGLLLLPFLSFSQQQEELKRVTVVISIKEVAPQKEIVQLPADNVPEIVDKPTPIETTKKKSLIVVKKNHPKQVIAITREKGVKAKTAVTSASKIAAMAPVNGGKEIKQTDLDTVTSAKVANNSKRIVKTFNSAKANSFSYIWIGIFLILAGLVFGLLFGKPAFLISAIGVVFIVVGFFI